MLNLRNFFTNTNKKSLATVFGAGVLAIVAVVTTVAAVGPTFNIFPVAYDGSLNTDYPLIDARNVTKNEGWSTSQSDHNAGVNMDPGDTVEFLVYYHNGAPDDPANTALSTVIRASVPTASATTFTVGASISASNAQTVTSASRGGDMTLRVSGSSSQNLSLLPGTTVWLPNRASSSQIMPDTITSTGVNIGDIRGCWQFSGFVKFRVQVSSNQPTASLSFTKSVLNVTAGNTQYTSSVAANPNDIVEFKLQANNTGQATISNTIFTDSLPSRLTFQAGSIVTSQIQLAGDLFINGLDLGSLAPGASAWITFRARVADAAQFSVGTTNLDNVATVRGQNPTVNQIQATARVSVTINVAQQCTIQARATLNGAAFSGSMNYTITGPATLSDTAVPRDFFNQPVGTYSASYQSGGPSNATFTGITPASGSCTNGSTLTFTYNFTRPSTFSLSIDKQVRNITTGTLFADTVIAQPSEIVEFRVIITNTGNSDVTNVITRDQLPSNMTFNNGTLTVNGGPASCDSCYFGNGINLLTLVPGATQTIVFRATLDGQNSFPVGQTTLINTGYVTGGNVAQISDTASVVINKSAPVKENGNPSVRP